MPNADYAKVILGEGHPLTFAQYTERLAELAGAGLDVGVVQVGVHEALVRPHIVHHLMQCHPGLTMQELLVDRAGADRAETVPEEDARALYRQRIPEDLEIRPPRPVPEAAGGVQWHLHAVNVQPAWDAVGGVDAIDWHDIRVGQVDTGYTLHQAFGHGPGHESWIAAPDCRSFEPFPTGARPGVDPMPFGALAAGHGTRIGATISGAANLPDGLHYRGIAPRVPHVMVRITDSVVINTRQAELVQALDYLVDEARVRVINISLGIFPAIAAKPVRDALAHARAQGVIVVCAAGNDVDQVVMPAALDSTIAVAGTTWQSLPWAGSSFGPEVDFSAPGANIFRADAKRKGVGKAYEAGGEGTSYSAAITTGAAALWLLRWKDDIAVRYGTGLERVEAFRKAAIASCRKPPGWQPQPFGAGILDIGRLCTDEAIGLP